MMRTLALSALLLSAAPAAAEAESSLALTLLASGTAPGGRCADGTMAGYYIHQGSDPSLYVIYLKGGGACYDEATCAGRARGDLGSSKKWKATMAGRGEFSSDCGDNPDFCKATHVYVPYCTGDCHAGNNTSPSAASWGLYFDGHANFAAIVKELQQKHGLNAATNVLLSGGSAGGVGTFKNIDFLQEQLPRATVKGAPDAGWFFPAALPADLPSIYSPSDWAHFSTGQHGNSGSENRSLVKFIHEALWQDTGLYPPACVAANAQYPWACASVDVLYKFIKAPLFVLENQYDSNQIFTQEKAPKQPSSAAELALLKSYVVMYGEAMRNSTAQVLHNASVTKKVTPDGLFHPSCLAHGVSPVALNGTLGLPVMGDWFFGHNKLTQYYRFVEHCPAASGGLPCNPLKECSHGLGPSPSPGPAPPPSGGCTSQLAKDGCSPSAGTEACDACAGAHQADLRSAGCTAEFVKSFCASPGPAPPPGPPATGCEAELDLICPVATDPTPMKCGECAKSPLHYAQLLKAGCTEKIVRVLCEARGGSARL